MMERMKVAFFEVDEWQRDYLRRSFPDASYDDGPLTAANAASYADAEIVAVRTYTNVDDALLAVLPSLKLLLSMTTGTDHVDLDACKRRALPVCNVTGYSDAAVAEHVFALLLAIAKNILPSAVKAHEDAGFRRRLQGFELKGKTFGIVGCGAIGLQAARIANGFGMKVIVYDIVHHDDWASENNFSYVPLDELLAKADAVTLHVPLNRHTRGLIGKEAFTKMKTGAVLLNTSRGEVVDTEALLAALEPGKLKGAGLDVLDGENFIADHDLSEAERRLCALPNVVVTPHNAYNSVEALTRRLDSTVANVRAFSENGAPGLKDRVA